MNTFFPSVSTTVRPILAILIISAVLCSFITMPAAAAGVFDDWSWQENGKPIGQIPGQNAVGTLTLAPVVVPTPPYSTDKPSARGLYLGNCPIGTGNAPQLRQTALSSGAQCRGACGVDCPPERCKPVADITVPFEGGTCTYRNVISCPSHYGCRDHDACYDICTEQLGDSSLLFGTCHGICNQRCYDEWNYPDCIIWAALPGMISSTTSGKVDAKAGPIFDRNLFFSDPPEFKPASASLPQNNITMLHYTGYGYFSTHLSNADLDCDSQTTNRIYTTDPQCGAMHAKGIANVWCNKPDEGCVDTGKHNGISREISYYTLLEDYSETEKMPNRIQDGPDRTYAEDGTVTVQQIYRDGIVTELCKINTKSSTVSYNCRNATSTSYIRATL